jgi:membrane protein
VQVGERHKGRAVIGLRAVLTLFRTVYASWVLERRTLLAAALAYYAFFALAPVIFIAFAVAEALFGQLAYTGQLYGLIEQILGGETAAWVEGTVASLNTPSEAGSWIAFLISAGAILWAATGLFVHLQNALDSIWSVSVPATRTSLTVVRQRLLAFLMVVLIGIALSLTGLASVLASRVSTWFQVPLPAGLVGPLAFAVVASVSLALIYRLLPRTHIGWGDVWIGALLTAVLITLGGVALSWFLRSGVTGTPFGAAGAYAVVLACMYYAAQAFLIGALFTRVYTATFGSRKPDPP